MLLIVHVPRALNMRPWASSEDATSQSVLQNVLSRYIKAAKPLSLCVRHYLFQLLTGPER
jgi:hypothetical protein